MKGGLAVCHHRTQTCHLLGAHGEPQVHWFHFLGHQGTPGTQPAPVRTREQPEYKQPWTPLPGSNTRPLPGQSSWHLAPKPLHLGVMSVSCELMRPSGAGSPRLQDGGCSPETNVWLEGWNFRSNLCGWGAAGD
ncbi:hypothetical protein mRhiFer1_009651 [Rhinolophus ferrumequinum]|uniref:Uncharacterized protein n=1 Tax=Rhinolophus ferrumequinum TaxID=59479 RepID=A0A7J7R6H7_RHIFE|nr:hypothetical protein mRhiFer1_009651 [Rhinolophus ferrumequinum]